MTNTTAKKLLDETIEKIDGAYAPATIRAYRSNFEKFISFCDESTQTALPSTNKIVAEYIRNLTKSGLKSASIRIAIASIASIHKLNELDDPTQNSTVKIEMRRMHRILSRKSNQAYGITSELLTRLIDSTDSSLKGIRDRALLMVAYDTMCRRSELVSLKIEDIRHSKIDEGNHYSIILRKSKTDQDSMGKHLYLSHKTSESLNEWLSIVDKKTGHIFRGFNAFGKIASGLSEGQINRIYKSLAKKANFDQIIIDRISGHSIRVGAAQDLAFSGASLPLLMSMGRWAKTDTVMRYIDNINPCISAQRILK